MHRPAIPSEANSGVVEEAKRRTEVADLEMGCDEREGNEDDQKHALAGHVVHLLS